ncbi:hypothetical protein [Colwellia sp. BRX8-4]|nr:hypothetical protein [Colwellia sp. BRX8-4]
MSKMTVLALRSCRHAEFISVSAFLVLSTGPETSTDPETSSG